MQYCELHFAGREFTVFIHLSLIENLQNGICRAIAGQEPFGPSGLLLGRGNEAAAIISSYTPQPGGNIVCDKNQFWIQFASSLQVQADQPEILGYYRIVSGANPVPDEWDLRVMKEFLPESASMLLLIGTSEKGGNTGSLFIWAEKDRQRLLASKTKVRFFNSREHIESRERAAKAPDKKTQTSAPGDVEKPDGTSVHVAFTPADRKQRSRWTQRTMIRTACRSHLLWVLAICIAAVPLWHLISTRQSPDSSPKSSVRQRPKPIALETRVESGRLRVTWDPASPILASALSAVLTVNPETGVPDTQVLGRNELMTGSAIFQIPPGSAKIRLVVFSEETSELKQQRSRPAIAPRPIATVAAVSKPDRTIPDKGNLPLAKSKVQIHNSRARIPSPAPAMSVKFREVEPMAVGFREEIWQISDNRVPPRPIRLIQPDRYYSLYPFTVDSVQIDVRVRIDTSGEVTSAEPLSSGNALFRYLSEIAVRAARESTFMPARLGALNVPTTAVLSYRFLRRT